jgi:uncharacterized protein
MLDHMGRRTTAAVTATTLLGAGAVVVAAGRYACDIALSTGDPPVPAGFAEPRLTVRGVSRSELSLTRSLSSLRPGTYGLTRSGGARGAGPSCHAVVGPVLDARSGADTVVRRLEWVTHAELRAGDEVRFTPQLYAGDPLTTLGLDYADAVLDGELGGMPSWFVPGVRDTWVIALHGIGATREHPLNLVPFLHRHGFPVLVPSLRDGSREGGSGRFGETAWHDVDAALRYALRYGARRVVLYGWSAGGSVALRAANRSPLRGSVGAVVLDASRHGTQHIGRLEERCQALGTQQVSLKQPDVVPAIPPAEGTAQPVPAT